MSDCGHRLNEVTTCCRELWHGGPHTKYEDCEGGFRIYEWNDNGESIPEEYGNSFQCNFDLDNLETIVDIAMHEACITLPKGAIFEIRCKPYPPECVDSIMLADYGRRKITRKELAENWGIAWYHRGYIQGFEDYETKGEICRYPAKEGKVNDLGGFVLIARQKA